MDSIKFLTESKKYESHYPPMTKLEFSSFVALHNSFTIQVHIILIIYPLYKLCTKGRRHYDHRCIQDNNWPIYTSDKFE